jgi:uncharacterized small protein (DUF1192 family)
MTERPLTEAIAAVLGEVDELEELDRTGRAHTEVQARLAYLHDLTCRLKAELVALRGEAEHDTEATATWQLTRRELRIRAPLSLRTPAQALIAGDVDLLRLVEYTGAAIALVQERRARLRASPQPAVTQGSDDVG